MILQGFIYFLPQAKRDQTRPMQKNAGTLDDLRDVIERGSQGVIFTGAGVSTESGIPDFRSPGGSGLNISQFNSENSLLPKRLEESPGDGSLITLMGSRGRPQIEATELLPN